MQWDLFKQSNLPAKEVTDVGPVQKKLFVIEARRNEIIRGLIIFLIISTTFLFIRIVLRMMGANPTSLFAGIIYLISTILLLPFINIFPQFHDIPIKAEPTFDASAFIAIFSYLFLVLLAIGIIYLIFRIVKTEKTVKEVLKKNQPVNKEILHDLSP